MNTSLSIALSGMTASIARLNASAANVAHAGMAGPGPATDDGAGAPRAYQPLDVVTVDTGSGLVPGGTAASYRPRLPSSVAAYDPTAPYADANGMVALPNVDLASEAVTQIEALSTFRANLGVFRVANEMTESLLDTMA